MDEFQPGKYTTRDGHEAIVEFRMREPTNTEFVLIGQVCFDEAWRYKKWLLTGHVTTCGEHALDLMPPGEVTYRGLACQKHNKDVALRELCTAEYVFNVLQRDYCMDCRWERITRRDGKVVKLELVAEEPSDEA